LIKHLQVQYTLGLNKGRDKISYILQFESVSTDRPVCRANVKKASVHVNHARFNLFQIA